MTMRVGTTRPAAHTHRSAGLERKPWSKDNYQKALNDYVRNGQDSFLIELGKYGLGQRDLVANMNWFGRVDADAQSFSPLRPDAPGHEGPVALRNGQYRGLPHLPASLQRFT